jgi:hypothetical protein
VALGRGRLVPSVAALASFQRPPALGGRPGAAVRLWRVGKRGGGASQESIEGRRRISRGGAAELPRKAGGGGGHPGGGGGPREDGRRQL